MEMRGNNRPNSPNHATTPGSRFTPSEEERRGPSLAEHEADVRRRVQRRKQVYESVKDDEGFGWGGDVGGLFSAAGGTGDEDLEL